jgi:hypothetical protein
MNADPRRRMSVAMRCIVYVCFGGVWLTGCVWLVLDYFFRTPTEFGFERHSWQPSLLTLHGLLSIASAYVFGWLLARHAAEPWRQFKRRSSGGAMTVVVAMLSVSGFALFFLVDSDWQRGASGIHDVVGLLATFFAVEHWRSQNTTPRP